MPEPLVVTISHTLGRAEAKRRLDAGLGHIRREVMPYVSTLDLAWQGDRLDFHVKAVGQTITGGVEIEEELVRIEIRLPWLLRLIGNNVVSRIRREGRQLLEKPERG